MTVIRNIGRLFTSTDRGVIERAALAIEGSRIVWVGAEAELPHGFHDRDEVVDAGGALVTAGLVDAHTHPVYAGDRLAEIERRSAGVSYEDIAAGGGGIGSTVAATRTCGVDHLRTLVADRLRRWLASGTTTVEAKTGYHLERSGEVEAIRLLASLAGKGDLPRVVSTFLPAHAVPPEFSGRADDYIEETTGWCREAAGAGATFCDVFCDRGYFTVAQARRFLVAGREAGMAPRIHADELARTGGAELAVEVGAASADHLLQASEGDARALAAAGVVATLAPATALAMGSLPPVEALLTAGAVIALGTDHNPGTSGLTDMTVVVALAVNALGLSVEQALLAATVGGGRSLLRDDIGRVREGAVADLVQWDAEHEGAFAWTYGLRPHRVWRSGREVPL